MLRQQHVAVAARRRRFFLAGHVSQQLAARRRALHASARVPAAGKGDDGADALDATSLAQLTRLRDVMRGSAGFEELGIGGLDAILNRVFKRTFASRMLPPSVVEDLKLQHTKGILLHGPPGTGKTLTARSVGQLLDARTPKLVNGPEVFSSLVGQSEETIRKLFEASEREWRMKGNQSALHVIIFDEIDAICKRRDDNTSSGRSRVHDNVVNQLLTKIDGLATQNNLLVIGVTNRKDLLDEALLRPGRLEVHIEIPLPDAAGRKQILTIHTRQLRGAGMIDDGVDLDVISDLTRGFTGAQLEGLVRTATAFALAEHQESLSLLAENEVDDGAGGGGEDGGEGEDFMEFLKSQASTRLYRRHFEQALRTVEQQESAYGQYREDKMAGRLVERTSHSSAWRQLDGLCSVTAQASSGAAWVENSDDLDQSSARRTRSVLVTGRSGSGRMTTMAEIAQGYEFEFVRVVSAHDFVSRPDAARVLTDAFQDAWRAPRSLLMLPRLDLMLDLEPTLGPLLNVLLQTPPRSQTSMLVMCTSAIYLENLEFDLLLQFPAPSKDELTTAFSGSVASALPDGSTFIDAAAVQAAGAAHDDFEFWANVLGEGTRQ